MIASLMHPSYDMIPQVTIMQVLKVSFSKFNLTSAFVYVRQTPTKEDILHAENLLRDVDLVMGDLNLDAYRHEDSNKIRILCQKRSKILNEITTIWFNQLDHVLLDCHQFPEYFTTSFRNHTSDHYVITSRLPLLGNKI